MSDLGKESTTHEKEFDNICNSDGEEVDDNASFQSALDGSLNESFLQYSSSYVIPPRPFVDFCDDDVSTSASLMSEQFEDAIAYDTDKVVFTGTCEQLNHGIGLGVTIAEHGPVNNEAVILDQNEFDEKKNVIASPEASTTEIGRSNDGNGATILDTSMKSEWINIEQEAIPKRATVNSLTFNQDKTCIAVATDEGYIIRTVQPLDKYGADKSMVRVHEVPILKGGITHIQILHSTSLLAIVRKSTPRILALVHAKTAKVVTELPFTSAVRRVEMNKMNLVILTADGSLHIFMFNILDVNAPRENEGIAFVETISILHSNESARIFTSQSASTSGAFFELCSHIFELEHKKHTDGFIEGVETESILVTKSAEGVGVVALYSSFRHPQQNCKPTLKLVKKFQAHEHGIARIAIGGANQSHGQKVIATASTQGTIIRVFNLPQCEKLYDLQRGSSPCTIFSISFNLDSTCVAVSSSKRTIHFFDLENNQPCHDNKEGMNKAQLSPSPATTSVWGTKISRVLGLNQDCIDSEKPLRSYAKVRENKLYKTEAPDVPTTISLVKTTEEREEQLVVCADAKLVHLAVRADGKSRPVQVSDILSFHNMKNKP